MLQILSISYQCKKELKAVLLDKWINFVSRGPHQVNNVQGRASYYNYLNTMTTLL